MKRPVVISEKELLEAWNRLRDAVSWFEARQAHILFEHTPQWYADAKKLFASNELKRKKVK